MCVWGGMCASVYSCHMHYIYLRYEHFSTHTSLYSDATHGVKQTACLCLLRMLRVNAGHVPIDQYANKIVQLLNEK